MNVRRKRGLSKPYVPVKLLLGASAVIIVILYIVSFFTVINKQKEQSALRGLDKRSPEKKKKIRIKGYEPQNYYDIQHDIYDKHAVERLGSNEQDNELAPVAESNEENIVIGWAVTITGCGSDPITEGAAVLKHSIHLSSVHGAIGGRYDYKMYAITHPDARQCAKTLTALGYELVERETPVAVSEIKGEYLKSRIHQNGCCGEKELVKLEAYRLTQHQIVVHMDLDTLVLKPLDHLFDWMIADNGSTHDTFNVPIMWKDEQKPKRVNAMFTRDYNMGQGLKKRNRSVQGGFLLLRPSLSTYREFIDIIKEGDFREGGGWGGLTGVFYGSMTFQGIVPYYYDFLHPSEAVELNRCVVNQMADNPRNKRTINDVVHGDCMTGENDCEDCRSRDLADIITAHFTLCQKPWLCLPEDSDIIQQRLCRKLHHEWHRIRSDLEVSWGRSGIGDGRYQPDHFYGHCKSPSSEGYIYIKEPFGIL